MNNFEIPELKEGAKLIFIENNIITLYEIREIKLYDDDNIILKITKTSLVS